MKGIAMGSKDVKLCDFVIKDANVPELAATDRNGVIRELVQSLARAGAVEAAIADELIAEIIKRETKGSTGFGKGVAVPHATFAAWVNRAANWTLGSTRMSYDNLGRVITSTVPNGEQTPCGITGTL
jgi:mannitol/fructose-specific phosphotransferase system IIA component (Ntr-type)